MQSVNRPIVLGAAFFLALVVWFVGHRLLQPSEWQANEPFIGALESGGEQSPVSQGMVPLQSTKDSWGSGSRTSIGRTTSGHTPNERWKGRIVDRSFAWPIPGATVVCRVHGEEVAQAQTDAQGEFAFDKSEVLKWIERQAVVEVRGEALAEVTQIPLVSLDLAQAATFSVPGLVHLSGQVQAAFPCGLWEGSFTVIREIESHAPQMLSTVKLADDGRFEAWLPTRDLTGECTLVVQHPEHPILQQTFVATGLNAPLGLWRLAEGKVLRGRVLAQLPEELRSQTVWVEWCESNSMALEGGQGELVRSSGSWTQRIRSVAIDAQGAFVVRGLREGPYRLRLAPPGAQGALFAPEVEAQHAVEVYAGESPEPCVLEEWWSLVEVEALFPIDAGPVRSLHLLGRGEMDPYPRTHLLLDPTTHRGWLAVEPMQRTSIRVQDVGPWLASRLEVPAIPRGQWAPATTTLVPTQASAQDLRLVVLSPSASNLADREAHPDLRIGFAVQRLVQSGSWEVCTDFRQDCDGTAYVLRNLVAGRYRIEVRANRISGLTLDWVPLIVEWDLTEVDQTARELRFLQGGRALVHGQDGGGNPLVRQFCEFVDLYGQPIATRYLPDAQDPESAKVNLYQGQTDSEGNFVCPWPLPSGSYLARIYGNSGRELVLEKSFEMQAGKTSHVLMEVR